MKSKWEQDKPGIRLQDRLEAKLCRDWSPDSWQDVTVLVAVSGGADSVALMRGLVRLKKTASGELHVAHLNHGLRGNEALADEAFVRKLSQSLGIPCHVGHANVHALATARGDGIEEAARTARYAFMEETAARIGARFVATAHTSDDQLETILYRILRGTGISGLCGIPSFRRLNDLTTLVRPLLDVSRSEVMAYLEVIGQTHRTDSSNLNLNHMRNRIRHDLLPLLTRDYHTRVGESILRLGELAGEVQRGDQQTGGLTVVIGSCLPNARPRCAPQPEARRGRFVLGGRTTDPHLARAKLAETVDGFRPMDCPRGVCLCGTGPARQPDTAGRHPGIQGRISGRVENGNSELVWRCLLRAKCITHEVANFARPKSHFSGGLTLHFLTSYGLDGVQHASGGRRLAGLFPTTSAWRQWPQWD